MKHFFLIATLVFLALLFVALRIIALKERPPQNIPSVTYAGFVLPYGYNRRSDLGILTFTGTLKKYAVEKGIVTLEFESPQKPFLFGKTETFAFDPQITFTTNQSTKDQEAFFWTVPSLSNLKELMEHSFAVTLQFKDIPLNTDIQRLKSQKKDIPFSIIFHTYEKKK